MLCYPSHQFRSTRHNVCEKFSKFFSHKTEMMKALLPLRYHPVLVTKLFLFALFYCLRLEHITLVILAKDLWHHCLRLTICVFDPCPVGTLATCQFGTYSHYNFDFFHLLLILSMLPSYRLLNNHLWEQRDSQDKLF